MEQARKKPVTRAELDQVQDLYRRLHTLEQQFAELPCKEDLKKKPLSVQLKAVEQAVKRVKL